MVGTRHEHAAAKRQRCRSLLFHLFTLIAASYAASNCLWVFFGASNTSGFVTGSGLRLSRRNGIDSAKVRAGLIARQVAEYKDIWETMAEMEAQKAGISTVGGGLSAFQGSQYSLGTAFICTVMSLPGIYSLVARSGQAKYTEKTYVMPGSQEQGVEMRSVAGGICAYFKSQNYNMASMPNEQRGKIRFVGQMKANSSEAAYIVACVLGALISVAFMLQAVFPTGPFGLGPQVFFAPTLLSPGAGWIYWNKAFREDIVEMQMEESDDMREVMLNVLGDKDTIEGLQRGVRFQTPAGQMIQLMEQGMEYVPGLFERETEDESGFALPGEGPTPIVVPASVGKVSQSS